MRFCQHCGTEAVAAYCKHCGAATPDTSERADVESTTPTIVSAVNERDHRAMVEPEAPVPAGAAPVDVARRQLVWETRFVMTAFLLPVIANALVALAQSASGVVDLTRFPTIVARHPLENMFLGMMAYLAVAAVVPLALFLLNRTGQSPSVLGLGVPDLRQDLLPAIGIGAASFGLELVLLVPLLAILGTNTSLIEHVSVGRLPAYYLVSGLAMSAITAIAEEVMMNGYLMTRLHQLEWSPRSALWLSLALRTSYHVYYGLGFLLTIPFGYLVTRSFQKHHRLNRPILAHFLFDAVLITIAILK